MKAYVDTQGKIRLFRPDMNMKRLNSSMKRLLLPQFDIEQLTKCLKCVLVLLQLSRSMDTGHSHSLRRLRTTRELIKIDSEWVPKGDGYSLYIRPTGISTHVRPPLSSKESRTTEALD